MSVAYIYPVRNLLGGSTEIEHIELAEACKKGDVLVADETGADNNTAALMDDAAELPIGVALEDGSIGDVVSYTPAYPWNVFAIKTAATKKYVAAADRFTRCDFTVFTSGGMQIDPATDVSHNVLMLGLADGESDDTVQNVVLAVFNLSGIFPSGA